MYDLAYEQAKEITLGWKLKIALYSAEHNSSHTRLFKNQPQTTLTYPDQAFTDPDTQIQLAFCNR